MTPNSLTLTSLAISELVDGSATPWPSPDRARATMTTQAPELGSSREKRRREAGEKGRPGHGTHAFAHAHRDVPGDRRGEGKDEWPGDRDGAHPRNRVAVPLLHEQGKEEEGTEVGEVRARAQNHREDEVATGEVVGRYERVLDVSQPIDEEPPERRAEHKTAQGPRTGPAQVRPDGERQHHQRHGDRERRAAQPVELGELLAGPCLSGRALLIQTAAPG